MPRAPCTPCGPPCDYQEEFYHISLDDDPEETLDYFDLYPTFSAWPPDAYAVFLDLSGQMEGLSEF